MDFHEQLQKDLANAMKAKNDTQKWVIRMLKSAIQLAEKNKGEPLSEEDFLQAVQKEIKTRNEAKADAEKAQRQELIDAADAEIAILKTYLPAQLSTEELTDLVQQTISETSATSVKDMGKVLKNLLPKLQGRATNAEASRIVKEELSKE
ncbi:MAG: GatB/YqeY domain-containing protein [Anaerolineaceae bacterium]|nr:GatB/YqeY domain-containing protein [Anaerolineaceae bacterium]